MPDPARVDRRRFVVLGASNVALGLDTLVACVRDLSPGPVEILCAHGHGRSYGVTTRVMFRELPSIGECGLWRALESREATGGGPMQALVTDIGNDLAYGSSVEVVVRWIERDLDRLQQHGARIVLGRMPIVSLAQLSPWYFTIVKSILFPGRPIELPRLLDAARALDEKLVATARARGIATVEPRAEWYGLDPIHVRRSMRAAAFRAALAELGATPEERIAKSMEARAGRGPGRASLRSLRPEFRRFLGREQRVEQPSMRFADGTSVAWY
jgi:hypothetical protein